MTTTGPTFQSTSLLAVLLLAYCGAFAHTPAEAAPAGGVMPLSLPKQAVPDCRDLADRVYLALEKQARYLLTTVHPWKDDANMRLLTDSKSGEHWIRPNTSALVGFCLLRRFGPYEEKVVGVSRKALLEETIVPMMRYVVATHVTGSRPTGDGRKWGNAWQSALWASSLGRAAWLTWDNLPADIREGVQRIVGHEADRIARSKIPHQIQRDTKAEENAWNSQIFSVGMLLMPHDTRRGQWEELFQKWSLSSFLRPADENSQAIVDGRPVSEQFTGANIYDDFTLENHGIIHPDYMTTFSISLGCGVDFAMTGRRPPEALRHNAAGVYENLKWFLLPDGGFVYPNGQDWRLFRNPDWVYPHVLMAVFAGDADAWPRARLSLDALERMQARSESGAVYYPGEYFFPSTQHSIARSLARTWLTLHYAKDVSQKPPVEPVGIRRLDSGKLILHRTSKAINSVSWGARVMAQCVPIRADRIVSPHERNGIGYVHLKGGRGALPVKVVDVKVDSGKDSFDAKLVLNHGQQVQANLEFISRPDGSFIIREKLTALKQTTTSRIGTGLIGILNNKTWIHENGRRRIELDGSEKIVESCSGKVLEAAARSIVVASVLRISSTAPLHVRYQAAAKPERGRVTDLLVLNQIDGEREWKAGEVISQFEATIRCAAPTDNADGWRAE